MQSPTSRPSSPRFRHNTPSNLLRKLAFYGLAITVGLVCQTLFFGNFGFGSRAHRPPPHSDWIGRPHRPRPPYLNDELPPSLPGCPETPHDTTPPMRVETPYDRPGLGHYVVEHENEYDVALLRSMIATTKGYYARDYSVWLGWNNMRYIIEAALLHAKLLRRTLIIPSYVYARGCEWDIGVCAQYATMVNRGDAIGSSEWRNRPLREQMGWMIPIDVMIDLAALRRRQSVITVAEYLVLHGLDTSLEVGNGRWDTEHYHKYYNDTSTSKGGIMVPSPSLYTIPNNEFDPEGTVRVDRLPSNHKSTPPDSGTPEGEGYQAMKKKFNRWHTLDLGEFCTWLNETGRLAWKDGNEMVDMLAKYGLGVVHTFFGLPTNYEKAVTQPIMEVAPIHEMKGLIDDYDHITEDVLLVPGELHDIRKPGSMFFTSAAPRDEFADTVLRGLVHVSAVQQIADTVADYMLELNGGRMWMAAHWRRGDFVRYSWTLEPTVVSSMDHILRRFREGAERLRTFREDGTVEVSQVPEVTPDTSFETAGTPLPGDRWFLATDERDPKALQYAREQNATFISEILADIPGLNRLFGWPILYTDVLALVEQNVMARAAFFFGHSRSSVVGGVVNLRGVRGMDPRTLVVDGDP